MLSTLPVLTGRVDGPCSRVKGKERKSIYIALFGQGGTLKALRHGSQFYLQITLCLPFLRERSPDVTTTATEAADIQLHLTTHLSTRKDERLSWPSWLTYSGWFTHISAVGSVDRSPWTRPANTGTMYRALLSSTYTESFTYVVTLWLCNKCRCVTVNCRAMR